MGGRQRKGMGSDGGVVFVVVVVVVGLRCVAYSFLWILWPSRRKTEQAMASIEFDQVILIRIDPHIDVG